MTSRLPLADVGQGQFLLISVVPGSRANHSDVLLRLRISPKVWTLDLFLMFPVPFLQRFSLHRQQREAVGLSIIVTPKSRRCVMLKQSFTAAVLGCVLVVTGVTRSVQGQAPTKTTSDALAVGAEVVRPSQVTGSLDELMDRTVGKVRDAAVARYESDFDAYWKASQTSREGKALEAIACDTVNKRNAATGDGTRWTTTAAQGHPTHPADIVEINASGKIVRHVQVGKGYSNVLNKLSDAKYAEMDILTDKETFEALQKELRREVVRANSVGRPLQPKFAALQKAVKSGRLLEKLPCGAPLPTRSHISKVAFDHARKLFFQRTLARGTVARTATKTKIVREAAEVTDDAVRSVDDVARAGSKAGSKLIRSATKGAAVVGAVVDVGFRANDAIHVEKKYQAGAISVEEREVSHVKNAAGMAGGWGGAFAGAKVGAVGGGAVGTACGGVGAPIGAVAGGVAGGVAGYIGGEAAAEAAAEWTITKVHQTGNTLSGAARSTKNGVVRTWNSIWK